MTIKLHTIFAIAALATLTSCATLRTILDDAAPVMQAACAAAGTVYEARACATHDAAGIPESDPRAAAAHAAGHALDLIVAGGDTTGLPEALRAFEAALEEVKPGAGSIGPTSMSDGGTAPLEPTVPDPSRPSPTLPLPPPAAMVSR
jgi:hypothetical protein